MAVDSTALPKVTGVCGASFAPRVVIESVADGKTTKLAGDNAMTRTGILSLSDPHRLTAC